jgi:uncharacterized protein (TIGR03905 family)
MFEYKPTGVCSKKIFFDIEDGKLCKVQFEGGCNGNLSGIGILVEGMDAKEVADKLKGNRCGWKQTSCPDQLAQAIEKALAGGDK